VALQKVALRAAACERALTDLNNTI